MAQFIGGSKKKPKIVLNAPVDLARWVEEVLGKDWTIRVEEQIGYVIRDLGRTGKTSGFILSVECLTVKNLSIFHCAKNLVELARRFQTVGYPKLLAEIDKRAKGDPITAQQIDPTHVIESRVPAIGHVQRALPSPRPLGLPAPKQLALPFKGTPPS